VGAVATFRHGRTTAQPPLRVQLLGSFGMSVGAKSAGPWPRLGAKRLVELVFLSPRRRIAREVASDTLFPDLAPRAATNAMYNALSAARAVLADLGGPAAGVLRSDRTHVYVPPDVPVEVDLELHERALSAALQMPPGEGRDAALVEALSEQRALLEDEPYADWSLRPRQSLELARQEARLALARDRSLGFGQPGLGAVIGAWENYFAHDPASEEAAAALMKACAAQGQRHLVARAYRRCCDGLKELGLEPSAALEEAYQSSRREATPLSAATSVGMAKITSNLPTFLSRFIGREAEQAEVCALARCSHLVTVTGAGGSGKTRLALEVAAELLKQGGAAEAFFVELAPVLEPGQVPVALAAALGVRDQAGRPVVDVLCEALSGQDLLIVVDNCEHLIGGVAELAERLNRACPKLQLLATSREPFGIDGEQVYRLGPLSLPPEDASSLQDLERSDAVGLFVDRARSHDSSFALEKESAVLVASICRRLDGIPLALELAAARISSMSLTDLDERLDQRFWLLTGGSRTALPRQRTLQATFDWSFELLRRVEQAVLERLSVFSGSFDLEAAEAVCSHDDVRTRDVADLLGSLVNKSLVVAERSSGSLRYSLLETVRQYGAERLVVEDGEAELQRARTAHAEYYLQLAERAEPMILGADQARWLKRLDVEWPNVRAALEYFLSQPGRGEEVLRMGGNLAHFFRSRCLRYGFDVVRTALACPEPIDPLVRATALCNVGGALAVTMGWESEAEMRAGTAMMQQGLELSRRLGTQPLIAKVLTDLSFVAEFTGDAGEAARCAEESLEIGRRLGNDWLIGLALASLGDATVEGSDKRLLFGQALAHLQRAGDFAESCWCLVQLAAFELVHENFEAAATLLEEDAAICEEIASPFSLCAALGELGETLVFQGRFDDAAIPCRRAMIGFHRLGLRAMTLPYLFNLTCCVARLGNPGDAARLTGAYDEMFSAYGRRGDDRPTMVNAQKHLIFLRQKLRAANRTYIREMLGDDKFELLYRAGAALTYDEAVALALRVTS
jgi:predicted ATPase/DNA-binding SARP family transcriptional activator